MSYCFTFEEFWAASDAAQPDNRARVEQLLSFGMGRHEIIALTLKILNGHITTKNNVVVYCFPVDPFGDDLQIDREKAAPLIRDTAHKLHEDLSNRLVFSHSQMKTLIPLRFPETSWLIDEVEAMLGLSLDSVIEQFAVFMDAVVDEIDGQKVYVFSQSPFGSMGQDEFEARWQRFKRS